VIWTLALVLKLLLKIKSLVHSWWFKGFCKSIEVDINLFNVFIPSLLSLLSKDLFLTGSLSCLLLLEGNFWIRFWFLLFCVAFWTVVKIIAGIKSCLKSLTPDIITRAELLQRGGLGGGDSKQSKDCHG
jgi:hypothetical protein